MLVMMIEVPGEAPDGSKRKNMLTILKWLFYLVVTIVVIIVAGSFLLPGEAVVTRSTEIDAPPEKVFAIVGDFHRFQEFSPWAELDPNTKYTYEGPPTGVGQKMSWTSDNANVGSGSQTITEYEPPQARRLGTGFRADGQVAGDLGPRAHRPPAPRRPGVSPASSTASPHAGSA